MNTTVDQAVEELARAIYDSDLSADWQKPLDGYRDVAAKLIDAGWTKAEPA
jgi:hypothetical protein